MSGILQSLAGAYFAGSLVVIIFAWLVRRIVGAFR